MTSLPPQAPPDRPAGHTRLFLSTLFGELPPDGRIALWINPGKTSTYYASVDAAVAAPSRDRRNVSTYVAAGIAPLGLAADVRPKEPEVLGIPAVWADVDYVGPGHKKQNLPPDGAAARALVARLPLEPTFVVNSGGGLQCWWLFEELWLFADDGERSQAKAMVQGWQALLRGFGKEQGWDVDGTHDLARLMRLPGSWNPKHGQPRRALLTEIGGPRYGRDAFLLHLPAVSQPPLRVAPQRADAVVQPIAGEGGSSAGSIRLRADVTVSAERRQELWDIYPEAAASWAGKQPGFQDQSSSAYDMSLASYAALAGWSDQEIVDLLVHHRRERYPGAAKNVRLDYYLRTLRRAREHREREQAKKAVEDGEASREQQMAAISGEFGVSITDLIRYQTEPAMFRGVIAGQSIEIGGAREFRSQEAWHNLIVSKGPIGQNFLPRFKPKDWERISKLLAYAVRDEEVGAEGTPQGRVGLFIESYLASREVPADTDPESKSGWRMAASEGRPFIRDGWVYFTLMGTSGLNEFIKTESGEQFSKEKLASLVKSLDWESAKRSVETDSLDAKKKKRSRQFWRRQARDVFPDQSAAASLTPAAD